LAEITVTGSRVIRDGTNSPTPLSVVGAEVIEQAGGRHIATLLETLPVFSSNVSPNFTTICHPSGGLTGLYLINLRGSA